MIVARDAVAGGLATDVEEGVVLGVVTINQSRVRIRDIGEAPQASGASFHSVLSSGAEDRETVAEEMKATYAFEVIWTNLPDEQLEKLREVFAS